MCGLTQDIFTTSPSRRTGLLMSNSAANEWCARTDATAGTRPMIPRATTVSERMPSPSNGRARGPPLPFHLGAELPHATAEQRRRTYERRAVGGVDRLRRARVEEVVEIEHSLDPALPHLDVLAEAQVHLVQAFVKNRRR